MPAQQAYKREAVVKAVFLLSVEKIKEERWSTGAGVTSPSSQTPDKKC
jgi:hypothetical protein